MRDPGALPPPRAWSRGGRRPARQITVRRAAAPWTLSLLFLASVLYTGRLGPVVADGLFLIVVCAACVAGVLLPRSRAFVAVLLAVGLAGFQVLVDFRYGSADLFLIRTNTRLIYYAGYAVGVYSLLRVWERRAGRAAVARRVDQALTKATPFIVAMFVLLALVLALSPDFGKGLPATVRPIVFEQYASIAAPLTFVAAVVSAAPRGDSALSRWRRPLLVAWGASFAVFAFEGRSVAIGVAIGLAAINLRPSRLAKAGYILGLGLAVLWLSGAALTVRGREVSFDGAVEALTSLVPSDDGPDNGLSRTRDWRLDWWSSIVADVRDEHFIVSGHGWGINIGEEYGVLRRGDDESDEAGFRYPHNVALTLASLGGVLMAVVFLSIPALTIVERPRDLATDFVPIVRAAKASVVTCIVVSMLGTIIEGRGGGSYFWLLIGFVWWSSASAIDPDERTVDDALHHRARSS